MEMRRSHSAGKSLWKRHDFGRSRRRNREDSEQANQTMTDIQHLAELNKPLGPLGRGPVPRPREKNDAFIHSWLQETQARHPHPLTAEHEKETAALAEQSGPKLRANRHRKRSRPSPEPPRLSLKPSEQPGYRFEKRARHKTRNDKYEDKTKVVKKRVLAEELHEPGTTSAAERNHRKTKERYAVGPFKGPARHNMLNKNHVRHTTESPRTSCAICFDGVRQRLPKNKSPVCF
jgi:hypothetical protein